ncbi:hypothetical protein C5Y93_18375 [Blastopirellula marina]|uniref:Uncharacterized protein n=1 Tax=Blastopirellula marina TaxID=124 RepID=A0A2S8GK21_9BACT|nr:hypothetical protein C5Y93_18375 [Blastopirellula marina]
MLLFGNIAADSGAGANENIGQKGPASGAKLLKQTKTISEIPSGRRFQCYVFDARAPGCARTDLSLRPLSRRKPSSKGLKSM